MQYDKNTFTIPPVYGVVEDEDAGTFIIHRELRTGQMHPLLSADSEEGAEAIINTFMEIYWMEKGLGLYELPQFKPD